ncbi:DUF1036 domain-containing protein [Microcystis aeruginosa]|jgi:uncharacterized membrane protein|uniref:Uncharacterized protein n=1 Tax=Microcystis aeruginosa (strain NIES-843 / IAM M-2473) TaxID=449447 RepID=B0JVS5_MICAN|nr:DUF1036 domain-containing protein [Microcystis aeruginosa]NCQ93591.1 DUF1036 domain-containing protein [Microcystis aeruginosa LG13-13]NCR06704.1 DUF1036 domain-containing protein [Microcystis aeruginosa LG13-03]NCR64905.1 DUF1036 domain-containing protein [Microcystis aeruginosa LG11-05]NCR73561.1 DUF1036 domain-containing protein [Microcystis aeruginosa LG13-12]BAG04668.1 unknown protein [Microcystis aeruginosa NIES-843]
MKSILNLGITTTIAANSILFATSSFSTEAFSLPHKSILLAQSSNTISFRNACSSPFRLAIHFKNLSGQWETKAWYSFSPGEQSRLNGVDTRNRYLFYYAEATDGSGKVWSSNDTSQTIGGRTYNMKKFDIGSQVVNWTQTLTCPDQQLISALKRIPSKYQPLPTEDYVTFRYNPNSLEIGVRIGPAVLRNEIEKIPEQRLKYTDYNRHTVKWFKYKGIDVSRRQILIGFRYRYQKLEDRPLIGGRFTVYDNAANVDVGVNLEVKNKQLDGNVNVRNVEADWASGVLGLVQNTYEIMFGSLTFLVDGKFIRPSDFAAAVAPWVINASTTDQRNLSRFFGDLNDLNSKGVIYLKRIDYDSQGVWYQFSIDESLLAQSASRLESMLNSWANR